MKNAFFLLWMGIVACKGPLTWKQAKSDCPQTGICQLEIEEKSKLVWKQDGTGAFYPSVVKGNQIVVRYSFTQDRSRETKDAFHSEKIYLEFPSETTRLVLHGFFRGILLFFSVLFLQIFQAFRTFVIVTRTVVENVMCALLKR